MVKIVGIRFKQTGKIYYFSPGELEIESGMNVIVETARGVEMGMVVIGNREIEESEIVSPLKSVIRIATAEDMVVAEENKELEKKAFKKCLEKIKKNGLDMQLTCVEYTFDRSKIIFNYTADGRVDFRELVKDLAAEFHVRIELRQIGVRDEAKLLGGLGVCGRALCCSTFLGDFEPVSIKMAKEQGISLNPTKTSGTCGRLLCCLKYEQDVYEELSKDIPPVDSYVVTPDGKGTVVSVATLKGMCRVKFESGEGISFKEYNVSDIKVLKRPYVAKKDEDEETETQ